MTTYHDPDSPLVPREWYEQELARAQRLDARNDQLLEALSLALPFIPTSDPNNYDVIRRIRSLVEVACPLPHEETSQ